MSERRFTDEEVALILREASEVQEKGPGSAGGGGLTLPQLKEIAGEVGLDPLQVEAAANRLVRHRSGGLVPFFGTPVAPEFEREIPGELGADDVAELVTTIRKVLGRRGIVSAELGAFEWRAQDPMGGRYVSVLPKGGSTRLRIFGNFRDGLALLTLGGGAAFTAAVVSLLAALGGKELLGAGILPLGMLLSVVPLRTLWRWRYRREEDALSDLTQALDDQIRTLVSPGSGGPAAGPEGPP